MEAVDLCTLDTGWLPSCHIRNSCTRMPKVRIANVAHVDKRTADTEIKTFKTFKRLRFFGRMAASVRWRKIITAS